MRSRTPHGGLALAAALCLWAGRPALAEDGGTAPVPAAAPAAASDAGTAATPAADKSRDDSMFGGEASPADGGAAAPAKGGDREADMFGGDSAPAAATATAAGSTNPPGFTPAKPENGVNPGDTAALGAVDESRLFQQANLLNDHLTIGGLMYLQLLMNGTQGQAFHQNLLESPNYMDLYADARPNDHLRAFVRARLVYDPSLSGGASAASPYTNFGTFGTNSCTTDLCPYLDQFWLKWDAWNKVFFTLGRQHVKWGTGHFWNPTDFLDPIKLNPLLLTDPRLGVDMLKIHVPVESLAWNFYGIITLDGVTSVDQIGYAGRAEFTAGPTEFTFSAAYKPNTPLKLGTDLSAGIGDLDFHAELGVLHPIGLGQVVTYNGNFNISDIAMPQTIQIPGSVDHVHDWLPQLVVGAEYSFKYTDQDSIVLGAEYFYNSIGYTNSNLYPALLFNSLSGGSAIGNTFSPLYNGQHYGAAYVSVPNPGSWNNTTFLLSWIGNLSDNTHVARLDWRQTVLTFLSTDLYAAYYFGGNGEFHYSYSVPPQNITSGEQALLPTQYQAVAAALKTGFSIQPTVYQIGGGLIVNM